MRNLSKILCAILVLAVLCSSLVLLVSAEEFTPTATIEDITANPASANDSIKTNGMTPSYAQYSGDYNIYKVLTADNSYVQLEALKDGKLSQNFQFQLFESSGLNYAYDANTYHYARFEFDIATENEMADLFIRSNVRRIYDKTNADGTVAADQNTYTSGATVNHLRSLGLEAGKFYHISVVQDLTANKFYIFVNGEQKACTDLFLASQHASWVAGDASVAKSLLSSIKVESDANNVSSIAGSTFCIDNLNCTTKSVDAALDIAEFANERYTDAYVLPVVPAIATVDGVAYSNVEQINNILSCGAAKEVEILRDSVAKITVNCPATIKTNGYTYNSGSSVTEVIDNGDGTVTVNADYSVNATYNAFSDTGATVTKAYYTNSAEWLKLALTGVSDNAVHGFAFIGHGATGYRQMWWVENLVTGDDFVVNGPYDKGSATGSSTYIRFDTNNAKNAAFTAGIGQYILIEADMSFADLQNIQTEFVIYGADGSTRLDTSFQLHNLLNGKVTLDEFHHITIVGDVDANKAYVFADNNLCGEIPLAKSAIETGAYFSQLRMGTGYPNSSPSTFAYDNVYIRFTTDSTLASAITAGDLSAFAGNIYGTYTMPELPVLAKVNGVNCYSVAQLESMIAPVPGMATQNIEILHAPQYTITVACDAIVNTNGLENVVVIGDGCTSVQNGNIITVDAPFIKSAYYTDATFNENVKSADSGNEIVTQGIANASTSEWKAQHIHNAYTGENFYKLSSIADGLPAGHIQWVMFGHSAYDISYNADIPTYVVYEFDIATESEAVALDITPNVRTSAGDVSNNGTYLDSTALMLEGVETFKFHHLTIVHDYSSNEMHVYLDNELVTSSTLMNATKYSDWLAGTLAPVCSGIKLQAHSSYKFGNGDAVTPLKVGQNLFIANAYSKTHTGDSTADLAAAIAEGNLSAWSGNRFNESYNLPKLPVLATVDGIECTTVAEIEALCSGSEAKTIELMRDADVTINVSCAAHTVIDNGITTINVVAEHKGYTVNYVPFTCTENGNIEYYHCDICGKNVETSAIDAYVLSDEELVLQAQGHMRANKVEAVAPTCSANGNIEYWYCSACGQNTTGRAPEAEILPDEALVLLATGHTRATKIEAVPATHTENGTIEYWHCDVCGLNTTGRAAEAEILPDEALVINATGHIRAEHVAAIPATHTENGVADYWYCADCDLKLESRAPDAEVLTEEMLVLLATGHVRAEHVVAVAPTHTAHGNIEYWYCADCNANYTDRTAEAELIPAGEEVVTSMGHQRAEYYAAVPATHSAAGTVAYYYCSVCDACFAGTEYNADKLVTMDDFRIEPMGHVRAEWVDAIQPTCTEAGVAGYYYCAECDQKLDSRAPDAEVLKGDALVLLSSGHVRAEKVDAIPATHTENGVAGYYYCADCEQKVEGRAPEAAVLTDEMLVILATGHVRAEKVDAIPATHTAHGVAEYYYCADCDLKLESRAPDAAVLTDEDLVVLSLGHERAELIPGTPATHTTAGTIDSYYCSVCEASFDGPEYNAAVLTSVTDYVIPALGHINGSWVDAIPATHTENGVAGYYYCVECDLKLDGEGSEAAVLTDAELVLLATGHVRAEKVEATPATCKEAGNIAYWHCAECGANFTGRAPEAELLADSEITILPAHKWGAEYVEVEDGHCRKCTVCEETLSVEEHTMNEDYVCTACGHTEVPTSFFDMLVYYFKQFLEMIANLFSGSKA